MRSRRVTSTGQRLIREKLLAASTSVAANVAEGYGRGSRAAFRHHLEIARGSAIEADCWRLLAGEEGLLTEDQSSALEALIAESVALITTFIKRLQ